MIISKCCGEKIVGEIVDGFAICPDCKEWSEVEDEENGLIQCCICDEQKSVKSFFPWDKSKNKICLSCVDKRDATREAR
jgi:hypothetical protein